MEAFAEIMGVNMMFSTIVNLFSSLISIASYVLFSLGLYTIAQRRGIRHPWLAWVPVGNVWMIGCISDQYQKVAKGRKTSRRKVLLGLNIALWIVLVAIICLLVAVVFQGIALDSTVYDSYSDSYYAQNLGALYGCIIGVILLYFALFILAIVETVFMCMSYYDLYASCNPGNAIMFLILGIFFGFLNSIFVFICRNKDDGMRAAYTPPVPYGYVPPAYTPPAPGYSAPVPPAYTPPAPGYSAPVPPAYTPPAPGYSAPVPPAYTPPAPGYSAPVPPAYTPPAPPAYQPPVTPQAPAAPAAPVTPAEPVEAPVAPVEEIPADPIDIDFTPTDAPDITTE